MKKAFILFVIMMVISVSGIYSQKKSTPAADAGDGSMFFITIDYKGEKTELKSTQFEGHTGMAFGPDTPHGKMGLQARAQNEKSNEEQFLFNGKIVTDSKGTFKLGETNGDAGMNVFSFQTSKFPQVSLFLCQSGVIEISSMPLKGGFVEGTFTGNCEADWPDQTKINYYTLSGSFKLPRR